MGLLDLPGELLGRAVSRGSIISTVGGFAASRLMKGKRKRWEKAKGKDMEAVLDEITAYETGRGAGRLLAGWMRFQDEEITPEATEMVFAKLLKAMDKEDGSVEDRARSRFVLSKALGAMEGFQMSRCRYETLQQEARALIRKNPQWRNITRNEIFQGKPFEAESIIGTAHRILLMLSKGAPWEYLDEMLESAALRDDVDYFSRLIAVTLRVDLKAADADARLMKAMNQWFEEYRVFKLAQVGRQEVMLNTGIAAATGGLPGMAAMDLAGRAIRAVFKRKKK